MSEMQYRDILVPDARELVMNSDSWAMIVLVARGEHIVSDVTLPEPIGLVSASSIRGVCITLENALSSNSIIKSLPTGSPEAFTRYAGRAAALVAAGVFTQELADAFMALALADGGASAPPVPRVRLEKGLPVMNNTMLVLTTGDYELDALVELARPEAPHTSYFAMPARVLVEASA